MEKKPSDTHIHQAAQWYARLRAPDCGPAERRAFQAWLESDPRHKQAFESAGRAARLVSGKLSTDPRLQALAASALGERSRPEPVKQRPRFLRSNLRYAAALVVAVGMGLFFAILHRSPVVETRPTALYANSGHQIQQIRLTDGSTLHLDAGARVSVSMGAAERQLILHDGRAFFAVAPDKSRPFSVSASGARVVALGTQFQVEIVDNQAVNVTLAEGSVAVTDVKSPLGWREVLKPGQQLQIDRSQARHETTQVDLTAVTSWSSGRLVFDGMPLRQVLHEINRYATTKVVLGDSALADIPIGGNFVAGGDTAEFVETLAAALPLRSVRTGANEIALFQRYETDQRFETDNL